MGQTQTAAKLTGLVLGAPEQLPELKDVESLSPFVWRILGQNPGPAPLQGTNTYLVGSGPERVLIDTSDGNKHWWPLVLNKLKEDNLYLTAVVLTHRHYDHTGGLHEVRQAFPNIMVYRGPGHAGDAEELPSDATVSPPPPPDIDESTFQRRLSFSRRRSSFGIAWKPQQRCWCDGDVPKTAHVLQEGDAIRAGTLDLKVWHTPGHCSDSICLLLQLPQGSSEHAAIFTGDTVLGGVAGTFDNLPDYERSLRRIFDHVSKDPCCLYPGHGAVIPQKAVVPFIKSMSATLKLREQTIIEALDASAQSCSAEKICHDLYGFGMSAILAKDVVKEHLRVLVANGRVTEIPSRVWGRSSFRLSAASRTAC